MIIMVTDCYQTQTLSVAVFRLMSGGQCEKNLKHLICLIFEIHVDLNCIKLII